MLGVPQMAGQLWVLGMGTQPNSKEDVKYINKLNSAEQMQSHHQGS
jgi:hypothetical protein